MIMNHEISQLEDGKVVVTLNGEKCYLLLNFEKYTNRI